ncbi:MAG: roadblock/LC7 domain-containing protein [Promethearchaeota archaeon]
MANLRESKIQNILKSFRERTGIVCSTLFTEDGFIITIEGANNNEDDEFFQSIAAICASIVTLAENSVEIIREENFIKQISIQAGDQLDNEAFVIHLEYVTEDIRLALMFPLFLNLGVIQFELNQTIHKLYKHFMEADQDENISSISTIP